MIISGSETVKGNIGNAVTVDMTFGRSRLD